MKKKLCLSKKSKIIAGVCGGIAEYFNIDATLVRLVWALLALISTLWPAIIIYIILWAVMPAQNPNPPESRFPDGNPNDDFRRQ